MNIEFLYLLGVAIAGVVGFVFGKRHERKKPQTQAVSYVSSGTIPEEPKKRKKHKSKKRKPFSGQKRTYKKRILTAETKEQVAEASAATVEAANALSKIDPPKKERKPRKPANVQTEPQIA